VILDTRIINSANKNIFLLTDKLAYYGVDIFQLRINNANDKEIEDTAIKIAHIVHKQKKIFIVNNRADIACISKADGLHLGNKDISPINARKIIGKNALIGKTVHSLSEAKLFQKECVDYLSIGPVFSTKIKKHLPQLGINKLKAICASTSKLIFAIGGINLYNVHSLAKANIQNIALCQGIILTNKGIKTTINQYKKCLVKAS